jgi:hypothetical protein
MTKLVTFKSHKINALNLVPYHLIETCIDQWHGPCRGHIDRESGHLYSTPEILEKETVSRFGCTLRNVQWDQHDDYLREITDIARSENKSLFFGTHSQDQLDVLTNIFDGEVLTFALSYSVTDYEQLLENIAEYHVYLLISQKIKSTQVDQEIIRLPKNDAVKFYKNEFDQLALIPTSYSDDRHYQIPYSDYLNPKAMYQHFSNLGFGKNYDFYNQWLAMQKQRIRL